MSLRRRVACSSIVVLFLVLLVACGADPPDKEMQQAQGAIDAARAAGADRYARDEFVAAEDSLKDAHNAVNERDYRLALTRALDSRDRAETATREATENKATARDAATRALAATDTAIADLRATVRATEDGTRPQIRGIANLRTTIADAETAVQEARTAFGSGDYEGATGTSTRTLAALREAAREFGPPAAPARRKR